MNCLMSNRKKYDWDEIKQAYIAGREPAELMRMYGIPESTLRYQISAKKWRQERQKMKQKVINKAAKKIEKQKTDKLNKLIVASDKLDDLLLAFLRREGDESNGYDVIPPMQAKELQALTRALKDAVDVKQELNGIISTVEQERLALERERLALERERLKAQQDKDNNEGVAFVLSEEAERYAE